MKYSVAVRSTVIAFIAGLMVTPGAAAGASSEGDPAKGKAIFEARCQLCHSVVAGRKGIAAPNLRGVVGRKAGSGDFAGFSPALKSFGKVWTPVLLDAWLYRPSKLVPGTRMMVGVPNEKDRSNLIAFLKTVEK